MNYTDVYLNYLLIHSTTSTSDSSHATETDGTNLRPSVTESKNVIEYLVIFISNEFIVATAMYTTLSNTDDIRSNSSSLEYVLDHRELHDFARQIADGMKHLHHLKITHR